MTEPHFSLIIFNDHLPLKGNSFKHLIEYYRLNYTSVIFKILMLLEYLLWEFITIFSSQNI